MPGNNLSANRRKHLCTKKILQDNRLTPFHNKYSLEKETKPGVKKGRKSLVLVL